MGYSKSAENSLQEQEKYSGTPSVRAFPLVGNIRKNFLSLRQLTVITAI
jgi:hypothetical protein